MNKNGPPKDMFYDPQEHVKNTSVTSHTSPSGNIVKRSQSTAKLRNVRGRRIGDVHIVAEHFVNHDGTMLSDAKLTFVLPNWTETFHYSYDDATDSYHHTKKNFTVVASSATGFLLGKNYKMTHFAPSKSINTHDKIHAHVNHGRYSHEA